MNRSFNHVKEIIGFGRDGRVAAIDHEKTIDTSFRSVMSNACLFSDMFPVRKNMGVVVGAEKVSRIPLCGKALFALCRSSFQNIESLYGPKQRSYLSKFDDSELYRAHQKLEYTTVYHPNVQSCKCVLYYKIASEGWNQKRCYKLRWMFREECSMNTKLLQRTAILQYHSGWKSSWLT